jgi:hypothetical protein
MSSVIPFPANRQPLCQLNFSKTLTVHAPNWVEAFFKVQKAGTKSKKMVFYVWNT